MAKKVSIVPPSPAQMNRSSTPHIQCMMSFVEDVVEVAISENHWKVNIMRHQTFPTPTSGTSSPWTPMGTHLDRHRARPTGNTTTSCILEFTFALVNELNKHNKPKYKNYGCMPCTGCPTSWGWSAVASQKLDRVPVDPVTNCSKA